MRTRCIRIIRGEGGLSRRFTGLVDHADPRLIVKVGDPRPGSDTYPKAHRSSGASRQWAYRYYDVGILSAIALHNHPANHSNRVRDEAGVRVRPILQAQLGCCPRPMINNSDFVKQDVSGRNRIIRIVILEKIGALRDR